jgi:hypothetical protein
VPVKIKLAGTNFAKPPVAGGTGGTTVHISAPDAVPPLLDYAIPVGATRVNSAAEIEVEFDTRTALPGKYDVQIWNPGGPTPPQRSNTLPDAFEILP